MLHLYPTEIILQAQLYKQTETRKRNLDNLVYLPTALSILKDWGLVGFCLHIAIGLAEYVKKRSPLMPHQQFLSFISNLSPSIYFYRQPMCLLHWPV